MGSACLQLLHLWCVCRRVWCSWLYSSTYFETSLKFIRPSLQKQTNKQNPYFLNHNWDCINLKEEPKIKDWIYIVLFQKLEPSVPLIWIKIKCTRVELPHSKVDILAPHLILHSHRNFQNTQPFFLCGHSGNAIHNLSTQLSLSCQRKERRQMILILTVALLGVTLLLATLATALDTDWVPVWFSYGDFRKGITTV